MLSEVRFGAFLVYAPRGANDVSRRARQFVRALKEERLIGTPPRSPSDYAASRLADEHPPALFDGLFRDMPLLVPVPRSSLAVEGGIWPAHNIAAALVRTLGFVDEIQTIVEPAIGTITLRGDDAFREP